MVCGGDEMQIEMMRDEVGMNNVSVVLSSLLGAALVLWLYPMVVKKFGPQQRPDQIRRGAFILAGVIVAIGIVRVSL